MCKSRASLQDLVIIAINATTWVSNATLITSFKAHLRNLETTWYVLLARKYFMATEERKLAQVQPAVQQKPHTVKDKQWFM